MIEPHLRSVGATTASVAVYFLIVGVVYMVVTAIAGKVNNILYETGTQMTLGHRFVILWGSL